MKPVPVAYVDMVIQRAFGFQAQGGSSQRTKAFAWETAVAFFGCFCVDYSRVPITSSGFQPPFDCIILIFPDFYSLIFIMIMTLLLLLLLLPTEYIYIYSVIVV